MLSAHAESAMNAEARRCILHAISPTSPSLTADVLVSKLYVAKEPLDLLRDLAYMRFKQEVTSVQKFHLCFLYIPLERLCTWVDETWISATPYGQERRLRVSEILLEFGIQLDILSVVKEQVQLGLFLFGSGRVVEIVENPSSRIDFG